MTITDVIQIVNNHLSSAANESIMVCRFCLDLQLKQPEVGGLVICDSDLHDLEWFKKEIEVYLSNGVSWIHISIMHTKNFCVIVSIAHGKPVGNPNPALNFSFEKRECVISENWTK